MLMMCRRNAYVYCPDSLSFGSRLRSGQQWYRRAKFWHLTTVSWGMAEAIVSAMIETVEALWSRLIATLFPASVLKIWVLLLVRSHLVRCRYSLLPVWAISFERFRWPTIIRALLLMHSQVQWCWCKFLAISVVSVGHFRRTTTIFYHIMHERLFGEWIKFIWCCDGVLVNTFGNEFTHGQYIFAIFLPYIWIDQNVIVVSWHIKSKWHEIDTLIPSFQFFAHDVWYNVFEIIIGLQMAHYVSWCGRWIERWDINWAHHVGFYHNLFGHFSDWFFSNQFE